jgi:hypothetical protein
MRKRKNEEKLEQRDIPRSMSATVAHYYTPREVSKIVNSGSPVHVDLKDTSVDDVLLFAPCPGFRYENYFLNIY